MHMVRHRLLNTGAASHGLTTRFTQSVALAIGKRLLKGSKSAPPGTALPGKR